jgi:hypothetical protein
MDAPLTNVETSMESLNKYHPLSPNGMDDVSRNESGNPAFDTVLQARLSRRTLLKGSFAATAATMFGTGLAEAQGGGSGGGSNARRPRLMDFSVVAKHTDDFLAIPEGYTAQVLYRLGDPISHAVADYMNDGSDSAASFEFRSGDHHDGMHYFGLGHRGFGPNPGNAKRGLLVINHENITQSFLHSASEVAVGFATASRVPAQIDKEVNAHGISIIEVVRDRNGFEINKSSRYNRRLTAASPMDISGPARGHAMMVTRYSPAGEMTRGTLNNCANGYTPWGTYLTCEENWAGYFKRPASSTLGAKAAASQNRYIGSGASNGSYGWANPAGGDTSGTDQYKRWDITPGSGTAAEDYRNAANTMGWVVEVDPYDPDAKPRKRTALGRCGHEGAMPGKVIPGKPLVYYMGDDARGEYIYKYVSTRKWHPSDAVRNNLEMGDKYLNDGKLYVARFNADGTGVWIELSIANPAIAGYAGYAFADQVDVLINCRIAADAVGATPMDRPEWTGVHPATGDVYVTLTNNTDRGKTGTTGGGKPRGLDAANPRYYDEDGTKGNVNGHVIRMREDRREADATTFEWDVYLFGAESDKFGDSNINVSSLTDDNDFSSPDGLWFSQVIPGLMWLQTDDGAYTDTTNCMMLAAVPGKYGDGGEVEIENLAVPSNGGADQTVVTYVGKPASDRTLRRFLVGPKGCEITGVSETPDGRAIFVNIQHPGEDTAATEVAGDTGNYQSHWPDAGAARPRSSTIVITKDDGGVIGT